MRQKLLINLLFAFCSIVTFAGPKFTVGDFSYSVYDSDNYARVSGYLGNSDNITIPSKVSYQGVSYPVSKIAPNAFQKTRIKTVVIPASVKVIEYSAFSGCSELKNVIFQGGVEKIEGDAFEYCGFDTFQIPNTVRDIGGGAFKGCKNLKRIDIPATLTNLFGWLNGFAGNIRLDQNEGWCGLECEIFVSPDNPNYSSENGILFNKDKTVLLRYPKTKKDITYDIPSSVKTIGESAFYDSQVQQMTIPSTVTSIRNSAFGGSQLKTIVIPSELTDMGSGVFSGCNNLRQIELPKLKTIPRNLFLRSGIESIVIPSSVKRIEEYAFYDCKNLKQVTISSAESIDQCAFRGCEKLVDVEFPNELKQIGEQAFNGCNSLTDVVIPNTVTSIGRMAFAYCTQLKRVRIPDNVSYLDGVFANCPNLAEVKGYMVLYPNSLNNDYHLYDTSCPFYTNVIKDYNKAKNSFSFYAYGKVNKNIFEWQKKREYETTEQWKSRVTEESRQQKINELIEQSRKDYIAQNTPQQFYGSLGTYDADYNTFPLKLSDEQTLFISVPQSEAQQFKEKWNKVKKAPVYGIVNDRIGVLSCSFTLKGKTYGLSRTYNNDNSAALALNLTPLELDFGDRKNKNEQTKVQKAVTIDRTIDQNIPANATDNKQTFAVIIGNERYTQVAQVPFANNDARIFAEYCRKTLGVPAKNVKVYENATYGTMIGAVSDIQKIARAFKGDINVIFYYAGHGIPDEATGDGYLLPIDADGLNMRVCYSLNQLYKDLGEMQAKSVTCFMDACFSGTQRGNGMVVAARGVAIKAKADHPTGNTVVFTAATDKQTAYPYEEKGHGMFTYYLLKKLRDTKGECTLGELGNYVCDEVAKQAVVTNGKEQTPVVLTSVGVSENWRTMKLK